MRRARAAAGAAFFLQGLVFIPVTQRLPEIKRTWDLGELAVSGEDGGRRGVSYTLDVARAGTAELEAVPDAAFAGHA